MTDTPTDKKLSERFAEANGGALSMREAAAKVAERMSPFGQWRTEPRHLEWNEIATAIRSLPLPPDTRDGEISSLTASFRDRGQQLAEAEVERGELRSDLSALRSAVATATEALEIIAQKRQCRDNLMGNKDVALAALAILNAALGRKEP